MSVDIDKMENHLRHLVNVEVSNAALNSHEILEVITRLRTAEQERDEHKEHSDNWLYYQDLMKKNGLAGITDLLTKYHAQGRENESLRAQLKAAQDEREQWMKQEPVGKITFVSDGDRGSFFNCDWFDHCNFKEGDKLYAHPVPPQQPSPAVAVPDSIDKVAEVFINKMKTVSIHEWEYEDVKNAFLGGYESASCKQPSITEQDAREMAMSVIRYCNKRPQWLPDVWLEDYGRALLNKLNAKHESKVACDECKGVGFLSEWETEEHENITNTVCPVCKGGKLKPESARNQCDGCASGQQINSFGMHADGDGRPSIVCQKSRYESVGG